MHIKGITKKKKRRRKKKQFNDKREKPFSFNVDLVKCWWFALRNFLTVAYYIYV